MRRILVVLVVVAVVVGAVLLATGGSAGSGSEAKAVRTTLAQYTAANAQKDYVAICKRFLAPQIIEKMRQIKIPCKVALARGLRGVRAPTLTVQSVKVTGATAVAEVHTGAANQQPLDGTIRLVKTSGVWKVLSQAAQSAKLAP